MATLNAPRVSARDRRALRMGFFLALPAVIYALGVKPYLASVRSANDQLQTQRELLAREEALVRAAPGLPTQIAAARTAMTGERKRLYTEADAIAATGALSKEVSEAFNVDGISLQHLETHDVLVRPDGIRELTVDVRAEGDFEGILDVLSTLETSDHLIRVSRLGVERGQFATAASSNAPPALAVVATIHGYAP